MSCRRGLPLAPQRGEHSTAATGALCPSGQCSLERQLLLASDDAEVVRVVQAYAARLGVRGVNGLVTTDRAWFGSLLGRKIPAAYGGAYAFDRRRQQHLVLINLQRIDRRRPKAVEIVVAEELLHLRDHMDGDFRRHAKHGYDRIAYRVAQLVGVPLEGVRSCLLPPTIRPYRYVFRCPDCRWEVLRKKRGRWACPRCWQRRHDVVPLTLQALPEEAPQS